MTSDVVWRPPWPRRPFGQKWQKIEGNWEKIVKIPYRVILGRFESVRVTQTEMRALVADLKSEVI